MSKEGDEKADEVARAHEHKPEASADHPSPVIQAVAEKDINSAIAVAGHPIHAMSVHFPIALVFATLGADIFYWFTADPFWLRAGVWSAGFAFGFGVAAALVGTAELLFVTGIRVRVASWNHAVAAMTLLALAGANWGLRLVYPEAVLPHGLVLSTLTGIVTGFAGWHGGKLVFDHGVGLMISPNK
ncbi:DUF2231 domain-containing protein [Arsenicitalea aurantiaca]|uniref:DUF2231 domain-containing protein n=1 Tax=Arsenicitalea aurantiaca TaxID=1783274 RepID=A0A433XLC1_9HYPH|nr:DUF2231 domain-containing protein [Arsenicitalea aurantiaca]RUT34882.1 DUF2231 domain-containing protein [Arsenicitalea aurantiaca]